MPPADIDRLVTGYWTDPGSGALGVADEASGGQWSTPPAFPAGGSGLVSTVDDYLAFARMLLAGGGPILSRPSVELMTTDQLTAAQKASTDFLPAYWDDHGWGFGMAVVTRRHDLTGVGTYGWDGGLGTSWRNDPSEDMITVLLTQAAFTSPNPPPVCVDFRVVGLPGHRRLTNRRRRRGVLTARHQQGGSRMPQQAWSPKRERQYEHIKEGVLERGESEDTAEEIAARTVNKERARAGEAKQSSRTLHRRHLVGAAGWVAVAPRLGRPHSRPALQRGPPEEHQGSFQDEQGPTGARRRPVRPTAPRDWSVVGVAAA